MEGKEIVAALNLGGMKGWAFGIVAALAIPYIWSWAKSSGVALIVGASVNALNKALRANVGDADVDAFLRDVTLAFIRLAEKKLPDGGLGPERKKFVADFLTAKFPIFRGRESELSELIDALVIQEDAALEKLSDANVPPSSPPAP